MTTTSGPADEVRAWTIGHTGGSDARVRFHLVHHRPWSLTWRVDTGTAAPVWLKWDRTGRNTEARVLPVLGVVCPKEVPGVVAASEDLGTVLLRDAGTVRERLSADDWSVVLRQYGRLQMAAQATVEVLRSRGVTDLSPSRLPGQYKLLVRRARVAGDLTSAAERFYLSRAECVDAWASELASDGVAATIQHDDLHSGNVAMSPLGATFLDWADSSIGHAYASLLYPLDVARRGPIAAKGVYDADRRSMFAAYLEGRGAEPTAVEYASLRLACRLAGLGRAIVWQSVNEVADRIAVKAYYSTGVQRWLDRLLGP